MDYPLLQHLSIFLKNQSLGRVLVTLSGILPGRILELFVIQLMQGGKRLHQFDVDRQQAAFIPYKGNEQIGKKSATVKGGIQTRSYAISV